MFGMGFSEILMIAIVAIVFLGPEKLPKFLVDVAKFFKSVKRAINDAKNSLDEEIKISELKENALEYKEKINSVTKEINTSIDFEDELKEVREIEESLKKEPKREVVKFKKDLKDKETDV